MHRLHDPSSIAVIGEDSLAGKAIRRRVRSGITLDPTQS
jgi:hypothetical protein